MLDDNQLELEINHILDSGANTIRFVELFKRLAKRKAIEYFNDYCDYRNNAELQEELGHDIPLDFDKWLLDQR